MTDIRTVEVRHRCAGTRLVGIWPRTPGAELVYRLTDQETPFWRAVYTAEWRQMETKA